LASFLIIGVITDIRSHFCDIFQGAAATFASSVPRSRSTMVSTQPPLLPPGSAGLRVGANTGDPDLDSWAEENLDGPVKVALQELQQPERHKLVFLVMTKYKQSSSNQPFCLTPSRRGGNFGAESYSGGNADQAGPPPYPEAAPIAAAHGAADAGPTASSQRDMEKFPSTGEHYLVWQCVLDWYLCDYAPDFCHTLEQARIHAHADGQPVTIEHEGYRYNVIEMYQENIKTGTRRCMRRLLWPMSDYADFQEAQQKMKGLNQSIAPTKRGRMGDTSFSSSGWELIQRPG